MTHTVRNFPYNCWFSGCLSVYRALACGCHPILYIIVFLKPSSLLFPFLFGKNNGVFKVTLPLGCLMILHNSEHETVCCKIIDVTNIVYIIYITYIIYIVYIIYRVYFYWFLKVISLCWGSNLTGSHRSLMLMDQEEPV